jgi:L-threonylcarbamoyladenylate synthase
MALTKGRNFEETTDAAGAEPRVVVMKSSSPRAIEWAAERLVDGGVVALPTDTVYGIAASLAHSRALKRLYEIKGRPEEHPLPVLVSSPSAVQHIAADLSHDVALLLDRYWPGPLTIVVPARLGMPREVTAGGDTVGIRMPNHPLAIEVIDKAGGAVACTSANRSGEPPARDAQEVAATIGADLDLILDGGVAPGGVASTVVAVDADGLRFVRNGPIPAEHLLATWNELMAGHRVK